MKSTVYKCTYKGSTDLDLLSGLFQAILIPSVATRVPYSFMLFTSHPYILYLSDNYCHLPSSYIAVYIIP